jgi:hypothetical protein
MLSRKMVETPSICGMGDCVQVMLLSLEFFKLLDNTSCLSGDD